MSTSEIFRTKEALTRNANSQATLIASGLKTQESRTQLKRLQDIEAALTEDLRALQKIESGLNEVSKDTLVRSIEALPSKIKADEKGELRDRVHAALRAAFTGKPLLKEIRDVVDGQSPGGADLVAAIYADSIRRAAAYVSPVANLVTVQDATASPLIKVNKADDTNRFHTYVTSGDESVPVYDPQTLESVLSSDLDILSSAQLISWAALDDIKDVDNFLTTNFGESIARAVSLATLKGVDHTGAAMSNFTAGGLIAASPVAGTTAALGALTYTDITNGLFSQLNLQYFNSASVLVSPGTYFYLLAQVDSTGRPLYPVIDGVLTIAGKPFYAATELDNVTVAGGTVALAGDFARAWTYAQGSTTTQVFRETYADQLKAKVISIHRAAGFAGISAAVKVLKNHA